MDEQPDSLTPEQWTAARMLVAMMGAEARGDEGDFDFDAIGMEIMPIGDVLFAMTEEHEISVDDAMMAAKVLIWSLIHYLADGENLDLESAVHFLGYRLAMDEPSS